MSTVNFNMPVEKELKDKTSQIFENYGMTTAQAVRMFLVNVDKTKKFRYQFDYQADNLVLGAETLQAIEQGRLDYRAGKPRNSFLTRLYRRYRSLLVARNGCSNKSI